MGSKTGEEICDTDLMASLVHKYTKDLLEPKPATVSASASKCIVLTGSTGSLGKHLLRQLLATPEVTKVYSLDRNIDASSKHTDTLASQEHKSRVEFLQVDYGKPDFGLPARKYKELSDSVDTIIHSAWKVNFNHSLESFEPVHVRGVRNLVDFQIQSPRRPRIVFISSVSSVSRWPTLGDNKVPIPDEFITDFDAAQFMGYGESNTSRLNHNRTIRFCSFGREGSFVLQSRQPSCHGLGDVARDTQRASWL